MALKRRNILLVAITFITVCLIEYFMTLKDNSEEIENNIINSESMLESMEWELEDSVGSQGEILIRWNSTKEDITMLVIAETTDYVEIGFSHDRTMNGSDIVIGWIEDGQAFLQDFHGTGNSQPVLDSQQDYDLLFGMKNKTHTILCFKRKLNTCDKDDIEITESTLGLLWSIGNVNSSFRPTSHKHRRGSSWINLLDTYFKPPPLDDVEFFEVGTNKTRTTYKLFTFYYWCKFVKVPNFGEKRHYIGSKFNFDPKFGRYIHHIIITVCSGDNLEERLRNDSGHLCFGPGNFINEYMCLQQITTYPRHLNEGFLPSHVGMSFGSTNEKPMYLLLQYHYNYNNFIKGFEDTTTVRLYHTRKLRQYEGSTMSIAAKHFEIIPAKQADFPTTGICSSSCLQTYLPPTGINIIAVGLHGHRSVTKMRLHQIRDGVKIKTVRNDNFRYDYANAVKYLKEELAVLPTDKLVLECIHDTRNRTETTTTGMSTYQEMCFTIVEYYPAVDLAYCLSRLVPEDVRRITGELVLSQSDTAEIYQAPFAYIGYFIFSGLYISSWQLDSKQADELRNLYLKGEQIPFCITSTTPIEYYTTERVTFAAEDLNKSSVCSTSR